MLPETQYARLGDLHLAYQVLGQESPDILLLDHNSNIPPAAAD